MSVRVTQMSYGFTLNEIGDCWEIHYTSATSASADKPV
jgi:hypothetical protein